jgi:autotransporter strand-loop-strand O-heptosyltransferase
MSDSYTYEHIKADRMYVLYANASYYSTVCMAVESINNVSDIPVIVYMLNDYREVPGATAIYWECDIEDVPQEAYIDRDDSRIYKLLIQRPLIVKHALENFADTICYVDSDSVATQYIDSIFDMYNTECGHPYFVEGIYDYLFINGRGGTTNHETLEYPACQLFNVSQEKRSKYRQTGYFVAGKNTINFLDEWYWMCIHPIVLKSPQIYAPYHEETILNVLLWKCDIHMGLPYIYTNASLDKLDQIYEENNWGTMVVTWFKLPECKEQLLFLHGEKNPVQMSKIMSKLPYKMSNSKQPQEIFIQTIPFTYWTTIHSRALTHDGDIVDLGCLHWDWCNSLIGKKRIIGVDPIETTVPEGTTLYKGVIGDSDTRIFININGDATSIVTEETPLQVEMLSWKTFCKRYNINNVSVLKINIEGGEYDVLNSMDSDDFSKIDQIAISFHDWIHPEWKDKTENALDKLRKMGYTILSTQLNWGWYLAYKSIPQPLKILFIAPHLSTGGMPAFLLKRIQALQTLPNVSIQVVEYQCYSKDYVVQRDEIIKLTGLYTLNEDKMRIFKAVEEFKPDIIHIDEMSERLDAKMVRRLYSPDRRYRIVETCHDVSFNPADKIFTPDAYAFCTPYHLDTFANVDGYKQVIEFPIDNYRVSEDDCYEAKIALGMNLKMKHVVNVGLWTSGKNQGEMLELAKQMPDVGFHFVGNQAGNFQDYWGPLMNDVPDNVKIWGERDDAKYFIIAADIFMFNSTWECNPLVLREAISFGKKIIARDLPQYKNMFTRYITTLDPKKLKRQVEDMLTDHTNYHILTNNTTDDFAKDHISLYEKAMSVIPNKKPINDYNIVQNFVGQPFLEITGTSDSTFDVEFHDVETQKLVHYDTIKCNHWIRLNREYFTTWQTIVYKDGVEVYNNIIDLTDKRVYIAFDSSSLGDTLAWIPYALEFKKKHKCHVIVSSFWNKILDYSELEFVEPGTTVNNLYAMYKLGWFYNDNKEPVLPNTIPLQQTATNILGLEYIEIKPSVYNSGFKANYKLVTIATNSTAGCKFWTREAWQEVINYLHDQGYRVKNVSLENNPFDNCDPLLDKSIESTIEWITQSEFFIGLSSGLSWLAWGLDVPVIMISNFTDKDHEFSCHRPVNTNVCHGCWNKAEYKFDKGDWDWCPVNKNTENQFICQRSITPEMVIDEIKKLL